MVLRGGTRPGRGGGKNQETNRNGRTIAVKPHYLISICQGLSGFREKRGAKKKRGKPRKKVGRGFETNTTEEGPKKKKSVPKLCQSGEPWVVQSIGGGGEQGKGPRKGESRRWGVHSGKAASKSPGRQTDSAFLAPKKQVSGLTGSVQGKGCFKERKEPDRTRPKTSGPTLNHRVG